MILFKKLTIFLKKKIIHYSTRRLTLGFFVDISPPNRYMVNILAIWPKFPKFPSHRWIIGTQYCVRHHRYSIYQQYFTNKNRNFNSYFILLFATSTTFSHMTSLKIECAFFLNLSSLSFWIFLLDKLQMVFDLMHLIF